MADSASAPRTIAGRYDLGAPLGRGGSAEVHRATDRSLGREVALKLFPATLEP
jgi:eukaryotic-like serine/threonine-protein kinase